LADLQYPGGFHVNDKRTFHERPPYGLRHEGEGHGFKGAKLVKSHDEAIDFISTSI